MPIEKAIAGWASGESKPKGMPAEKFGPTIVDDIVGDGTAGLVWRGPNAGAIKWLSQFAPQSVCVSIPTCTCARLFPRADQKLIYFATARMLP